MREKVVKKLLQIDCTNIISHIFIGCWCISIKIWIKHM